MSTRLLFGLADMEDHADQPRADITLAHTVLDNMRSVRFPKLMERVVATGVPALDKSWCWGWMERNLSVFIAVAVLGGFIKRVQADYLTNTNEEPNAREKGLLNTDLSMHTVVDPLVRNRWRGTPFN